MLVLEFLLYAAPIIAIVVTLYVGVLAWKFYFQTVLAEPTPPKDDATPIGNTSPGDLP